MPKKSDAHQFITRFAPSPTGELHTGHAFSALLAYRAAQAHDGRFLLRIEDIDITRCKPAFTEGIYADLHWLGIEWEEPVRQQSLHLSDYQGALDRLKDKDLTYPCFCTRKEILAEIKAAETAPHGPEGPIYPGTCKHMSMDERHAKLESGAPHAWRLNLDAAQNVIDGPLGWQNSEGDYIVADPKQLGDVVLARKDTPTSYHLSVVWDDALQDVTHVIRGEDLLHATHIHIVLQKLFGFHTPIYQHHKLLLDENGERFAKRNKSVTLHSIRESGVSAASLIKSLGL